MKFLLSKHRVWGFTFIDLDADEGKPSTLLSGDRNISTNGRLMSGILVLSTNTSVSWTTDIHNRTGNIGLADGSAQQMTDASLLRSIHESTNLPARLALP
jgi:prepilin-type processing-associated H-X9-DG protein